jgi:hypothetical protein
MENSSPVAGFFPWIKSPPSKLEFAEEKLLMTSKLRPGPFPVHPEIVAMRPRNKKIFFTANSKKAKVIKSFSVYLDEQLSGGI